MYIQHIATHVLQMNMPILMYIVESVVYTSIEGVVWSPDSLCEADLSPDMNNCVCVKTVWE